MATDKIASGLREVRDYASQCLKDEAQALLEG